MIKALRWYLLALLVFAIDQVTKMIAVSKLHYAEQVEVFYGFNWTLLYNKGAAFSFLAEAGGWQRWFFITLTVIVSTGLVVWIRKIAATQYWLASALALVLGGALGNLYDRFVLGHVVDFIQWYYQSWYWPAFNIADAAICIGAVMLILEGWVTKPKGESHEYND